MSCQITPAPWYFWFPCLKTDIQTKCGSTVKQSGEGTKEIQGTESLPSREQVGPFSWQGDVLQGDTTEVFKIQRFSERADKDFTFTVSSSTRTRAIRWSQLETDKVKITFFHATYYNRLVEHLAKGCHECKKPGDTLDLLSATRSNSTGWGNPERWK